MSFESNVGQPRTEPTDDQCVMVDFHHPDCECASCLLHHDVQCLEPYVGRVNGGADRVCGACAVQAESEDFTVEYRPETRFVIVHPEMGVYLGSALGFGFGFWSKIRTDDREDAVTFVSREEAEKVVTSWDDGIPTNYIMWPVLPDGPDGRYASVAACVAAGLDAWGPAAPSVA